MAGDLRTLAPKIEHVMEWRYTDTEEHRHDLPRPHRQTPARHLGSQPDRTLRKMWHADLPLRSRRLAPVRGVQSRTEGAVRGLSGV